MTVFLYALGSIAYQMFTLWLALIGVLLAFDVVASKFRSRRNRRRLNSLGETATHAALFGAFALAAAAVDTYLLSPALGSGINFFFAG